MKPQRHQRSRKKGSRLPAGVVCVTRPSIFGNPFNPKLCEEYAEGNLHHRVYRVNKRRMAGVEGFRAQSLRWIKEGIERTAA